MAKNPSPSLLDAGQIIKRAFDEGNDRLRVETEIATVTVGGNQEILITDTTDAIKIGNGSGQYMAVNSDGSINVSATSTQMFTLPFDSIVASYPSGTVEVYVSKVGGTSGTTQQTVTVTYTDSTKALISSVVRT